MKQINGVKGEYKAKVEALPVGAYVCRIESAKVEENKWGERLAVKFEIVEGEHKGYFAARLASEKAAGTFDKENEPKYKGFYRLNVPTGDGSEKDGWAINKLNKFLGAVEASNAGYKWNWDENSLTGKAVGFVFREFEWEVNGNTGFSTEAGLACSVADARKNSIKLKPRLLNPAKKVTPPTLSDFSTTDEEVPF